MNILFVHQNFPGQFPHLAPALAARGHRVLALTDAANRRPSPVPVLRYRSPDSPQWQGPGADYARHAARGAVVARACAQLAREKGYVPDLIVGHVGWGEMLFLREVWPRARLLAYAEFFYRSEGLDVGFDPEFRTPDLGARIGTRARQAHILMAMQDADAALAPTQWQAATFPDALRDRIRVIHDGIDTLTMCPDHSASLTLPDGRLLRAGDEVVSFVNRNLEPYRGFHIFMRALPAVLAARPRAQVVILGGEGTSYGAPPPGGGSWKDRMLAELGDRLDLSRVHFLGRVPHAQFRALMQVTRVHAYLTYPFVLSWSMLEAMSAGALVIGSRTGPVEEVIRDGENGRLVDFLDLRGWSDALVAALTDPSRDDPLRRAARQTVLDRYDLHAGCLPVQTAFVESLA